ncbi:Hypothetical predicted protein [Cloeon dipterum]|uniref:Uncharacterized protein n=1 Tax=Cloeon dipterum TaxID=197152 RepID=A0A8S1CWR7_9INSE|nr:Hypothetical predicted protein [Cloeon dipterum]
METLIWLLVSAFAVLGTLLMANTVWQAFRASPTQTIVENPSFPVWNVDFPALTICNLNKIQRTKALALMSEYLNMSKIDAETEKLYLDSLFALGLMRYPYYHHAQLYIRRGNKRLMDFEKCNLTDLMFRVMAKQNEILGTCYWKGKEIGCDVAFRLQITEEGFCYSFNSKTSENPIPPDMDSPPFQDKVGNKQPWRNNAAGRTTGLEVFFKSSEEEYLPADQRTPGYNLIIHNPSELPDVSRALFLPRTSSRVTLLAVTASRVHASPELARLSLKDRGCTMVHDGQDDVQENCKARCRILDIVKHCHCVPYFGVRRAPVNTPQCTIKHAKCLAAKNAEQRNIRPPEGSIGFRKTDLVYSINCSCPPSCSTTDYTAELLVAHRMDPYLYEGYAYIDVYFKDLEIVSYVRDVKFGLMDLLVSFGGLAGLFLGFSIIKIELRVKTKMLKSPSLLGL